MIKKMLGCGGAFSMLALAACGGHTQEIGDAASGSGGSSNTAQPQGGAAQSQAGSSATQPRGGSASSAAGNGTIATGGSSPDPTTGNETGRGGAAWAPGTCDPPCSQGYGCYEVADDPAGFCAPLCDTDVQGQTPDADLSCSNSVRGGAGTCVYSLSFGWPIPGPTGGIALTSRVVTGLCSNACDPILQDCPAGYTCDMTDTYSALNQQGLYACMPNKNPHALGDACDGTGDGECGPSLTCSLPNAGPAIATCEAFCDSRDPNACPTGKTCTETVVTMQDNDPNIGVCL